MTASPNLAIIHIAASENQKEVRANAAFDRIDAAITETLTVSVASASQSPTQEQVRQAVRILITGAAVTGRTVILPAVRRLLLLSASASNDHAVAVLRGTTSLSLAPGNTRLVYLDGSVDGLEVIGAPAGGSGGGSSEIEVLDGGTSLGTFTALNLTGSGVAVTDTGGGQVTIDIPGGSGGSGGGSYAGRADVIPAMADFAWVNQGSAVGVSRTYGVSLSAPPVTSDNNRCLVKAAPAAPYRLRSRLAMTLLATNYVGAGLCFRESTTGKLYTYGMIYRSTVGGFTPGILRWNSATSYNGDVGVYGLVPAWPWWGLRDDGTDLHFEFSSDGDQWGILTSVARSAFFTPDQVGIYINPLVPTGVGSTTMLTCLSFEVG